MGVPQLFSHEKTVYPMLLSFTLGLLLLTPILLATGIILRSDRSRHAFHTAFALLFLGTLGIYATTLAGLLATDPVGVHSLGPSSIEGQVTTSDTMLVVFTLMTVVLGTFLFVPGFVWGKSNVRMPRSVMIGFLIFYCIAVGMLAKAAQKGGAFAQRVGIITRETESTGSSKTAAKNLAASAISGLQCTP
jgi:hypothetical protein